MNPTPRTLISLAPRLLLAALFVSGPLWAQEGAPRSGDAQGRIDWAAESYTHPGKGTDQLMTDLIPKFFWDYQEHGLGVDKKAWDGLARNQQLKAIEQDRKSRTSKTLHDKYEAARERMARAINKARGAKPKDRPAIVNDALREVTSPEDLPVVIDHKLGPKYGAALRVQVNTLRELRDTAPMEELGKKVEGLDKEGSLKGVKELEKGDLKTKKEGLEKVFEKGRDGKDGLDDEAAAKAAAAEVGKLKAGGQMKDAGRGASKYGKDKMQVSLFAVSKPLDGVKPGGTVFDGAGPTVSGADRQQIKQDLDKLKSLPSGAKLMAVVEKQAPEVVPAKDRNTGGLFASNAHRANLATGSGYDQEQEGAMFYSSKLPSGAAGATFFDPKDKKTYIALDTNLKKEHEGVRLAVMADELSHVEQQQARVNAKKEPLVPSRELEKGARLKALQVYGEYYKDTPSYQRPQDTEVAKKLSTQYDLLAGGRRDELMQELDYEYGVNRETSNQRGLADLEKAEKAKLLSSVPGFGYDKQKYRDTNDYYQQTLRDNDKWLKGE